MKKLFFVSVLLTLLTAACSHRTPSRMAYVESDEIDVASKIPARIETMHVSLGDRVKKGDLLITLRSDEIMAKVAQARAGLDAARAQLQMARNGVRAEEKEMAERQLNMAEKNHQMTEKMFLRIIKVCEAGGISLQEKEMAELRYQIAAEKYESARSMVHMIRSGARPEQIDQLKAQLWAMEEKVNEAESYQNELSIRAPQDGEIKQINAQAGEMVTPGFPVVTLIDADRYCVFNLREDQFQGMKTGDKLNIYIPALDLNSSMVVVHIAAMADFARYEATSEKGSWDVRSFEVRARPVSDLASLRPGMSIRIIR